MKTYICIFFSIIILVLTNIMYGSVNLSLQSVLAVLQGGGDEISRFIVLKSRMPAAVVALLAGAALSSSGLLLQTQFRNPLAGPSVLGISGGAALGVALVTLTSFATPYGVIGAAFLGAMAITAVLLVVNNMVRSNLVLLIVGLLFGYLVSALITILNTIATSHQLQSYVAWGMGDFGGVGQERLWPFALSILVLLFVSLLMIKPMDAVALGDSYAQNLGVDTRFVRTVILVLVGSITAITTAYCGPISFIGLAVPHIARMLCGSGTFRQLLPLTMLTGAVVALVCNLLSTSLFATVLPLNAVTPLIGVPVIVWVVMRR